MCRTGLSGCPKKARASWPTQFPSWRSCPRSVPPPVRPTASDAPHDFFNLSRPSQPGLCFAFLLGRSFWRRADLGFLFLLGRKHDHPSHSALSDHGGAEGNGAQVGGQLCAAARVGGLTGHQDDHHVAAGAGRQHTNAVGQPREEQPRFCARALRAR